MAQLSRLGSVGRFGSLIRISSTISSTTSSNYRLQSTTAATPNQWDVYAVLCLQRPPIIGPELNWLERRLKEYLTRVEIGDSLYSDHEMRHFEDLRRAERIASGVKLEEKDLEDAAKQTAQDFEEASLKEAKEFKRGNRVTKADLTNNQQSIDRSLDKYLYLVKRQTLSSTTHWLLPQAQYDPSTDHSLRATAERALLSLFPPIPDPAKPDDQNPSIYAKFHGNTPSGFYSYRYPRNVVESEKKVGSRLFFFKANLDPNFAHTHPALAGQTEFGERVLQPVSGPDFAWLTRTELAKQLPEKYWLALGKSIYPDELVNLDALMQQKKRKFTRLSTRLQKVEQKMAAQQNSGNQESGHPAQAATSG